MILFLSIGLFLAAYVAVITVSSDRRVIGAGIFGIASIGALLFFMGSQHFESSLAKFSDQVTVGADLAIIVAFVMAIVAVSFLATSMSAKALTTSIVIFLASIFDVAVGFGPAIASPTHDTAGGAMGLVLLSYTCLAFIMVHSLFLVTCSFRMKKYALGHLSRQSWMIKTQAVIDVSRLTKSFRHDVRQPLNTIGILSGVGKVTAEHEEQNKRFSHISRAQKSTADMLTDFLDELTPILGHQQSESERSGFNIKDLIDELTTEYAHFAEQKGVTLKAHCCDAMVFLPRKRVSKLIRNGLDNAIKYTSSGYVLVCTRHLWKVEQSKHLLIEIIDSGPGIDNNAVDESLQGWGFGTQIIRNTCNSLGAKMLIGNRKDGQTGTKLSLRLPIKSASQLEAKWERSTKDYWTLILTDENQYETYAKVISEHLDIFNYQVTCKNEFALQREVLMGRLSTRCMSICSTEEELDKIQELVGDFSANSGFEFKVLTLLVNSGLSPSYESYPNLVILNTTQDEYLDVLGGGTHNTREVSHSQSPQTARGDLESTSTHVPHEKNSEALRNPLEV